MNSGHSQAETSALDAPWVGPIDAASGAQTSARRRLRLLVDAPRWLLLGTLVFAPWAYGATREWALQTLNLLLGLTSLGWLVACLARRRWPNVPAWPLVLSAALLVHGWWMALNAHHGLDPATWSLGPTPQRIPGAPGSADGATSIGAMLTCSGLLGVLLFCCELARHPVWRKRIWLTMVWTACSIALLGILQKMGGEAVLALTWEPAKRDLANNFAMFRNRNNAGAWLNLTLPLVALLALVKFPRSDQPWARTLSLIAVFVVLAGIQLNPSRAGWVIALALVVLLVAQAFWHHGRRRLERDELQELAVHGTLAALGFAAVLFLVFWGGWQSSWRRLGHEGIDLTLRLPIEIYLRMIPDAGLTGYGPGTFQAVFPAYQAAHDFGGRQVPAFWTQHRWIFAHQDYLQTLIEWGYLGTSFWAALIGGGWLRGAVTGFRARMEPTLQYLLTGCLLGLAGVLVHATMDFPLQIASIQLYVAVLVGLCWGARGARRRRRRRVEEPAESEGADPLGSGS